MIQNMFPIRENHDFNGASRIKGNILVLDSDKARQQFNATILRKTFVVWSANNDDEAIDLVDTQRVDLVILNLDMQNTTSGWGFLSVLWSDGIGKSIPVIVLTESMSKLKIGSTYWEVFTIYVLILHMDWSVTIFGEMLFMCLKYSCVLLEM